jgi:putative salt-induced outer membrane protein
MIGCALVHFGHGSDEGIMRSIPFLLLALACARPGLAEVVVFKNGDKLTGSWLRVTGGRLSLKSEVAGEVSLPLDKIQSFSTEKAVVLLLKGGGTVQADKASLSSGVWQAVTAEGTRTLDPRATVALYPREIYLPRSPERTGRPWKNWQGNGELGYSLVRGDRQAGTLNIGLNMTRRQPDLPGVSERFRTNYSLNLLLANARTAGQPSTSANSISTGLRQDFLFTSTNFLFLIGGLEHIESQGLKLRQTYGAGIGRDLLHWSPFSLSVLGGVTFVLERFNVPTDREDSSEALVGEKLSVSLSPRFNIFHHMNFYYAVRSPGRYRFETNSTLNTRVFSRLSFTTSFTDRYLSDPLPGLQRNETLVTTGLSFRF